MDDFKFDISKKLDALATHSKEKIKKSIEEPPPEKRFESVAMQRQKAELEAIEAIALFKDLIERGFKALLVALDEHGKPEEYQVLANWFKEHDQQILTALNMSEEESNGQTLDKQINFPRPLLNTMYEAVHFLADQKKYDEAQAAIMICLQLNPNLPMLWLTYGSILQNKNDQEGALYVYNFALMLDDNNPLIYAHMARSWIALGDNEEANNLLDKGIALCESLQNFDEVKKYCQDLKEWMK